MLSTIRRLANEEAPEFPITSANTLAAAEADERAQLRTMVYGAVGVGALALLLSAIGLYAVVAFAGDTTVRGIALVAGGVGDALELGVVLYDGDRVVPFGDRLFAAPVSCLWGA